MTGRAAYRTGWCVTGSHARCSGTAGSTDRPGTCRCACHSNPQGESVPDTATATVDVKIDTQSIRDQITMLADLLGQMSDTLAVASAELYKAAAPDTDRADEEAVAKRTVDALRRNEFSGIYTYTPEEFRDLPPLVGALADEGVPVDVQSICDPAHGEDLE